ncbi:uncharacterized protein ARMOST_19816 [Armillaria ostoyae]|uniref:Uncharacterized protein n=1 Tax=Armillaria ostoyae TaxID=47428 RepID=A0A284S5R0_ARMOS|nr:uncharacterized protein ARMOST_19816 [Armillaria ostoyae]
MYRYEIRQLIHRLFESIFHSTSLTLTYYEHPGGAFHPHPYSHLTIPYQDVDRPDDWALPSSYFRSRTISDSLVDPEPRTIPASIPPGHELRAKLRLHDVTFCQPIPKYLPRLMIPLVPSTLPFLNYRQPHRLTRNGVPGSRRYPIPRTPLVYSISGTLQPREPTSLPYHLRVDPEPYTQEPSPSPTNYTHEPSPIPMTCTWSITNGIPRRNSPPPTSPDSSHGSG